MKTDPVAVRLPCPDPTPAEIAEACRLIREAAPREPVGYKPTAWSVPTASMADVEETGRVHRVSKKTEV